MFIKKYATKTILCVFGKTQKRFIEIFYVMTDLNEVVNLPPGSRQNELLLFQVRVTCPISLEEMNKLKM